MAVARLRLENTTDGYQYDFYPIQDTQDTQRKEAFSIAPPGLAPSGNLLLGVSGMQGDITIRATLWNDGNDRANGTAPTGDFTDDTVETLAEQVEWLQDYIHAPDFSTAWELTHVNPQDGFMYNSDEVFVESIDVPTISADSPKWREVTVRLRKGQSVG
jgi:hypothetical protein